MPIKDLEDRRLHQREYSAQHYYANQKQIIAKTTDRKREQRDQTRAILNRYLKNHPCADCGQADPVVLVIEIVGEVISFNTLVRKYWSETRLRNELTVAETRCRNCSHKRQVLIGQYKEEAW